MAKKANKTAVIKPIEKLTKSGKADVLFVLPYQRDPSAEDLANSRNEKMYWSAVKNSLRSFAAITVKARAGALPESQDTASYMHENGHRITDAIDIYEPNVIVFMGQHFARIMGEGFDKKGDIRGTFGTYKIQKYDHTVTRKKTITCMALSLPEDMVNDPQEFYRMAEMMAKLECFRHRYSAKPNIVNLDTYKSASEYIDFLSNEHTGLIGFDTETYSLNRVHHVRLGSMQFAHDEYESRVLLWDSKHQALTPREMDKLKPKLVHLFGSTDTLFDAWVTHNGMFDNMVLKASLGTDIAKDVLDTMYLTHLMDENRKFTARVHVDFPMALKTLVLEFLAFPWYSEEALKARSNGSLMDLPLPEFLDYSGYDPIVTLRLLKVLEQWSKLEKYDGKVMNLLRKLHGRALRLYSDISRNGFQIDKSKLLDLLRNDSLISKNLREIEDGYRNSPQIRAVNAELAASEAGVKASSYLKMPWVFDMKKAKHRNALFFDSKSGFQYPSTVVDGVEKKSVDKSFQKQYKDSNPVIAAYSEAQGLTKLRDAYIKPLFETLFGNPDPHADTCDGRVHPWFHLTRTVTGRVASSNCNTQQVPRSDSPTKKAIKSLFCAKPGKVLLQADLSAAEVRVWGGLSNDKRICELSVEAFELRRKVRENPDDLALREEAELKADFHKQTYGLCFNKSPKDVTKSERQDAKKLSFGLIYGMGDNSIAREIGKELREALDIKKRFFGVYTEGTKWLTDMQDFAVKHGYVETPLGRRRRFPQVFTGNGGDIAQAKRYAVNAPVQATASDYAMLATILLNDEIKRRNWQDDVKIVNCVHDSVVLEITASEECLRAVSKIVRRIFTKDVVKQLKKDFGFQLNAPVDIDIEVSQWNMRKCKCCGSQQYHTDGKTCTKKIPVLDREGKPKLNEDGTKKEKVCGSKDYELVGLNAGWGYLTTLAENDRSFGLAAKGFAPVVDVTKKPKKEKTKEQRKADSRDRQLAFLSA